MNAECSLSASILNPQWSHLETWPGFAIILLSRPAEERNYFARKHPPVDNQFKFFYFLFSLFKNLRRHIILIYTH